MVTARSGAHQAFLSSDLRPSRLAPSEFNEFLTKFQLPADVHVSMQLPGEAINTCGPTRIAIPIDHFEHGFTFPVPWEFLKIFRFYGIVPAQLTPNGIGLVHTFICYLRSISLRFTLRLFRKLFTLKIRMEGANKTENYGFVYFTCPGLKVVNLPNKVASWPERFLMFEGNLSGLPMRPVMREESIFEKPKKLKGIEKEICSKLSRCRADFRYYLGLWPQVAGVEKDQTTLFVPELLPYAPEESLTNKEKRLKREAERSGAGPESSGRGNQSFDLPDFMTDLTDLEGRRLTKWDKEGKGIFVSSSLPNWGKQVTRHAQAVAAAVYGKANYLEVAGMEDSLLVSSAAQASLRSTVINHRLGVRLQETLRANKILEARVKALEEEREETNRNMYKEDNLKYQKSVMKELMETFDIGIARMRSANIPIPPEVTFASVFPEAIAQQALFGDEEGEVTTGGDERVRSQGQSNFNTPSLEELEEYLAADFGEEMPKDMGPPGGTEDVKIVDPESDGDSGTGSETVCSDEDPAQSEESD